MVQMVFETSFLISIRHIDFSTGLSIVRVIAKDFNIDTVTIKKVPWGETRV